MNYAEEIGKILTNNQWTISTTESCTGGLLSSKLTDISGSSAYITLNLVTYANDEKIRMLNVKSETLETHGAVSKECAFEMAKGLKELTQSDICVSTTGIAGPTGGSKEKPVGLMYTTIFYSENKNHTFKVRFNSVTSRIKLKELFVNAVLKNIYTFLYTME